MNMAHTMQLVSSAAVASSSSSSSSCGAIQPRWSASPAAIFGHGVAGSARIPCQRLLLKGMSGRRKQAAAAGVVVRASDTTGIVKEVTPEVKGIYYSLTLEVSTESDVFKWYQTPGQYPNLIPANSAQPRSASFFLNSPPQRVVTAKKADLQFLIQDVPGAVANELVNSKPGDSVIISINTFSHGFNMQKLQGAESVLMFASGYGLGPIRAFIEAGFQANERKHAILYTMYAPNQEPYLDRHPLWKQSGVTVKSFENVIMDIDNPDKTVVLMVASEDEQEKLTAYFKEKRVPEDHILTLFGGYPTRDNVEAYSSKVLGKPNFLKMGELHVPFSLKI